MNPDFSPPEIFTHAAFDSVQTFISQNSEIGFIVASGVIAAYAVKRWAKTMAVKARLSFLNIKHHNLKLPKHLMPDSNGWFSQELVLCMDYYRLYTLTRKDLSLYDKALMYLRKAHELGRRVMPLWIKYLLGVLVFSEAAVFGMVIAELGLDSVTPSQQPFYGSLIGLVLAIVLMLGTHFAGEEWHRNDTIKKAGDMGREVVRSGKLSTLLIFTMIFPGIQALSIFVSRAYGFASIEGRKAYEIIRKFHTREEYLNRQLALQIEIAKYASNRCLSQIHPGPPP
jgi:uncharacterized membrane protein YidH (DUF202 family)